MTKERLKGLIGL